MYMNRRNAIRRIATAGTGLTILGATAKSASAHHLSPPDVGEKWDTSTGHDHSEFNYNFSGNTGISMEKIDENTVFRNGREYLDQTFVITTLHTAEYDTWLGSSGNDALNSFGIDITPSFSAELFGPLADDTDYIRGAEVKDEDEVTVPSDDELGDYSWVLSLGGLLASGLSKPVSISLSAGSVAAGIADDYFSGSGDAEESLSFSLAGSAYAGGKAGTVAYNELTVRCPEGAGAWFEVDAWTKATTRGANGITWNESLEVSLFA